MTATSIYPSVPLDDLINASLMGMLVCQPVGLSTGETDEFIVQMVNEAACAGWRTSPDQLIGQPVSPLFSQQEGSLLRQQFSTVFATGQRSRFDLTGISQAGESAQRYTLLVSKVHDRLLISFERPQTELLERVMNTAPTAIVVQESIRNEAGEIIDFRMTKVNQLAATIMQNPINKIEHRRISQYFPGLLTTPLFALYKEVVRTGQSAQLDVPWNDAWYAFSVAQFGDGVVASAQDITTTRQHRQQIEQVNSDLKRSNENLQAFAYVASHDLQEPLRKIVSFANILNVQYAGRFDADVTDIIRRITAATERMQMLIKDLLSYAQVDEKSAAFKQVSLSTVLDELMENELWATIQQHKAVVSVGALPTLLADAGQMRQLFQNLLSNAIKFSRPDAVPQVRVASRLVGRADIPASSSVPDMLVAGQFHEISVTDNGIGFDEKYLGRIFQMFQRLHGRTRFPGSGIGLAICQKIVEKHGGTIAATSQPGNGSTFRVYLPAST